MSSRHIVECDRCGTIDSDGDRDRSQWGQCYAASLAGVDRVGARTDPADLCGGCLDDLARFLSARFLPPASNQMDANQSEREPA